MKITQYCPICEAHREIKARYRIENLETNKVSISGYCKCGYILQIEEIKGFELYNQLIG